MPERTDTTPEAAPSFELRLATEADRTYLQRLNFLTEVLGDEDAPLRADQYIPWREFYADSWQPEDGAFIAYDDLGIPAGGVWLLWGRRDETDGSDVAENDTHNTITAGIGHVANGIPELSIAVEPRFRGQGLGTVLLNAAIEQARAMRAPGISLAVDVRNPRAHELYRRVGFNDVRFDEPTQHYVLSIEF